MSDPKDPVGAQPAEPASNQDKESYEKPTIKRNRLVTDITSQTITPFPIPITPLPKDR